MKTFYKLFIFSLIISGFSACEDYLDVPFPTDQLTSETAFGSESTINATVLGMYREYGSNNFAIKNVNASLMSDELFHTINASLARVDVSNAQIFITNFEIADWSAEYRTIFAANLILEQLPLVEASVISEDKRNAFLGEAHYLRAASYLDLVNYYGDVPLVVSTNVDENISSPRAPKSEVNALIEQDLLTAVNLLPETVQVDKKRINNKYQAYALLARFYLYQQEWTKAEAAASEVINQSYNLPPLLEAFNRNSSEIIFATGTVGPTNFVFDNKGSLGVYLLPIFPSPNAAQAEQTAMLHPTVLDLLPESDPRRINWIRTYHDRNFPFKYVYAGAQPVTGTPQDFVRQRLAEVYLIRAEARAMQNNLSAGSGALFDINQIRIRAGVEPITGSLTQEDVMTAIEEERLRELFAEGFRWIDLKRWGKADEVLGALPHKSANYQPYMKLWPILDTQVIRNPNMTQTPGYENQ